MPLKDKNAKLCALGVVTHFKETWCVERLKSWYRGAAPFHVLNNNGVESNNLSIKQTATFRSVQPIQEFFQSAILWLKHHSQNRSPQCINFIKVAKTPTIEPKDERSAIAYATDKENKFHRIVDSQFYVSVFGKIDEKDNGRSDEDIAKQAFNEFQNLEWTSFDQFKSFLNNVAVIKEVQNGIFDCTCTYHAKHFTCSHGHALAIRLGKVQIRKDLKTVLLGQKRKRGRPHKAFSAWERQPYSLPIINGHANEGNSAVPIMPLSAAAFITTANSTTPNVSDTVNADAEEAEKEEQEEEVEDEVKEEVNEEVDEESNEEEEDHSVGAISTGNDHDDDDETKENDDLKSACDGNDDTRDTKWRSRFISAFTWGASSK